MLGRQHEKQKEWQRGKSESKAYGRYIEKRDISKYLLNSFWIPFEFLLNSFWMSLSLSVPLYLSIYLSISKIKNGRAPTKREQLFFSSRRGEGNRVGTSLMTVLRIRSFSFNVTQVALRFTKVQIAIRWLPHWLTHWLPRWLSKVLSASCFILFY